MEQREFKSMLHFLQQEMKVISFPATRQQIISSIGDILIPVSFESRIPIRDILLPIKSDSFSCAAEFYCALLGSL